MAKRTVEFTQRLWNLTPSCFKWKVINPGNSKRPNATREWGDSKGWSWNLQLFMFVNQDLNFISNLPNDGVENETDEAFWKCTVYSCKWCWRRVFRVLIHKLFALGTYRLTSGCCQCREGPSYAGGKRAWCHIEEAANKGHLEPGETAELTDWWKQAVLYFLVCLFLDLNFR